MAAPARHKSKIDKKGVSMFRKIGLVVLCVTLSSVLTGCITTNVKGFTDRDYSGYKVRKVSVRAPNASFTFGELLENSFVKELRKNGVAAQSFMERFPPTRRWTNQEVATELMQNDFDSIMYVTLVGSDTSSETIGYINSGTASVYGNKASFSGSSTAISAIQRFTSTRVRLFGVESAKIIWIGDSQTNAGGLAFMGDETQTDSIASEVVAALKESGHF